MKRSLLSLGLFLVSVSPALAAVDFSDVSGRFADAPFSRAQAAGISVLVSAGAVQGNPDGSFAASRTLNRAEFLKIVYSLPGLLPAETDRAETGCFPDVRQDHWFSRYVCLAKDEGKIKGYPDGLFHPERPVNYAEALKILSGIFDYDAQEGATGAWYQPYADEAAERGTALPGSVAFDVQLTRGEMARLAAAFFAESEGQLEAYRAFERGRAVASSSSSVSSAAAQSSDEAGSVSSASSVSSSSSVSSVSSISSSVSVFPAFNSILMHGEQSLALMDGVFVSADEDGVVRSANVKLVKEVKSLSRLVLIDQSGRELGTFKLVNDAEDNKWKADIADESDIHRLPKGASVRLGVRAYLKATADGGGYSETLEPREFSIQSRGVTSGVTSEITPTDVHLPSHRTAFGRITGMRNALATSMSVQEGTRKMLASFAVSARSLTGSTVRLQSLTFILQTNDVSVSYVRVGGSAAIQQADCSVQQGDQVLIVCPVIPEELAAVSLTPATLSLYGDLALKTGASSGSVQIRSVGSGMIGQEGTIRWTDSVGTFNWVEQGVLLEHGPVLTVTK